MTLAHRSKVLTNAVTTRQRALTFYLSGQGSNQEWGPSRMTGVARGTFGSEHVGYWGVEVVA
eukprot:754263-Hanusia_phi.AAC.1